MLILGNHRGLHVARKPVRMFLCIVAKVKVESRYGNAETHGRSLGTLGQEAVARPPLCWSQVLASANGTKNFLQMRGAVWGPERLFFSGDYDIISLANLSVSLFANHSRSPVDRVDRYVLERLDLPSL